MMERLPEHIRQDIARAADGQAARALTPLTEELPARRAVCPQHGEYWPQGRRFRTGIGLEFWYPCPACEERRERDLTEAKLTERHAREKARLEEMIGHAAIPPRFVGRSFDNYTVASADQQNALTVARDYAEDFDSHAVSGESLLFLGRTGTGKSHLAAAILQAIMPKHCGLYATAADVIDMIRSSWRRDSERSQAKVLATLTNAPLLVIDEIGVQYGTESEQNTLFQVIDRRYRGRKPFILMANRTTAELNALLGDAAFDRLREVARTVKFDWDSYRITARRERNRG